MAASPLPASPRPSRVPRSPVQRGWAQDWGTQALAACERHSSSPSLLLICDRGY